MNQNCQRYWNFTPHVLSPKASKKHGILYLITRSGYLYLFDVPTATLLHTEVITQDPIFATAEEEATNGILGVNTRGTVCFLAPPLQFCKARLDCNFFHDLKVVVAFTPRVGSVVSPRITSFFCQIMNVAVNDNAIVKFVQTQCNNYEVALRIAATANLGGADDLFMAKFNNLLNEMNIQEVLSSVSSPSQPPCMARRVLAAGSYHENTFEYEHLLTSCAAALPQSR